MLELERQRQSVDIYLPAGVCRGVIETAGRQRLSDFLGAERDQIAVSAATVVRGGGSAVARDRRVLIEKRQILFVVEIEPADTQPPSTDVIERESHLVIVGVGPYWIRGTAHLPPGGQVELLFSGTLAQFLPLTEARVVSQPDAIPRTFLINREHRHSLIV